MKLSKIYSNRPSAFEPIIFNDGFNVIIGKIKLAEEATKDSHNLGKSKLAELIDFGFLKKRSNSIFLFKHYDRFCDFVFFFEIKLNNGKFLTIRRSVNNNTKISLKKHEGKNQDYTNLIDDQWDYANLAIGNAKLILDSILNLTSISPWDYRMAISYALRRQDDFNDIFQLQKFGPKHISWKPYIGHLLGFDSDNLKKNYELKNNIDKAYVILNELQKELGLFKGNEEEMLKDALSLKIKNAEALENQLNEFNFNDSDAHAIESLSDNIDVEIEELNRIRYYVSSNLKKLKKAESKKPASFSLTKTEKLFEEAGVLFGDQIKKSYEQLLEFNRLITTERVAFIQQQIVDLEHQLIDVSIRLKELNDEKALRISFFSNTYIFDKYKEVSKHLVIINTEINSIKNKLDISEQIKLKKQDVRELTLEKNEVIEKIRVDRDIVTRSDTSVYKTIKTNFTDFVRLVLDKNGLISTEQNGEGNLIFHAGFVDEKFNFTSESDGCSYKKILCMGFDLSINIAYSTENFIRFIYHDGGLETLDSRKKKEFLKYVRLIPAIYGVQYILTVIDSDIPSDVIFREDEIALTLHDDGDEGLLFKMPSW